MDNRQRSDAADGAQEPVRVPRRPRRSLRLALVAVLVVPLALALVGFLVAAGALQFSAVATRAANILAKRFGPWPDATLTAERASLSGFGKLSLVNVRLTRRDGSTIATIDSASGIIRPFALLRGNLIMPKLRVVGANITTRQQPDSIWDAIAPFVAPDTLADTTRREIRIDDAWVVRSRIEARYIAPGDSALRIDGIDIHARDLHLLDEFAVRLDTLGARIYPPLRPGTPARLSARLALSKGVVSASDIRLSSDSSNVTAHGSLLLPGGDARKIRDINFRLTAAPLDFRDIGALVPGFDQPGSLRFDARVGGTRELLTFSAEGTSFDGATFTAKGDITPANRDSTRYVIDAKVRGLNPQLWTKDSPNVHNLSADAHVDLRGTSPDSVNGRVHVDLQRVRVNARTIAPSTIDALFIDGTAHVRISTGLDSIVAATATGRMRPFDALPVLTLNTRLTQLADTTINNLRLSKGEAQMRVSWHRASGLVTLNGNATVEGGVLALDGSMYPFRKVPTWTIEHARIRSLDLSCTVTDAPQSRIDAAVEGEGRGFDIATMVATGTVWLGPSRVDRATIDTGTFATTLTNGVLDLRGDARTMRGSAFLVATMRPLQDTITFRVDTLNFRDIAIDTTKDGARAVLTGSFVGYGSLPPDTFPNVAGTLTLGPSRIGQARVASGMAKLALESSHARAEGHIRADSGSLDFTGTADLFRNDSGHVRADWQGDIAARGKYEDVVVDTLRVRAALARGILTLDTLLLRSNVVTGTGWGTIAVDDRALPPDTSGLHVRIVADSTFAIRDALPLKDYSMRGGTLIIDAKNARGGIDATGKFVVRGLISPGVWADSLLANGTARFEHGTLGVVNATFSGDDLGYGKKIDIESLRGTVVYDSSKAKFDVNVAGDRAHTMRLTGTAVPQDRAITLADMTVVLDLRTWTLAHPASIVYSPRIVVDSFALQDGPHRIAIHGTADRHGTQDFTVTLDAVPLKGFGEFVGLTGIDGEVDGVIRATGPAANVTFASNLRVSMLGTTGGVALESASEGRLLVTANLKDKNGKTFDVNGSVPFRVTISPSDTTFVNTGGLLALTVKSDSFAVGWLAPLLKPAGIDQLDGAIRTDFHVAGTYRDPELSGTGAILTGRISYPAEGIGYRDMRGTFTLGGNRIHVQDLHATSGGSATLNGDVIMETAGKPTLDIKARFDGFRAARNEWVALAVTGSLDISGELAAPVFTGNLRLDDTDIFADPVGRTTGGQAVELKDEDYRMLEFYFGLEPAKTREISLAITDPWSFNLNVTFGSNTWLKRRTTPEMRVQLTGSLDVRKAPHDSIQFFGTVEALTARSYFEQFNKRFAVTSGTVTFNGSMMEWVANLDARYVVPSANDPNAPEATITLNVAGGINDLKLTLGGDPAMEMADVLSYLATGRPAKSAAEFGDLGDIGASLAADRLAGVLEQSAAERVGLDVVEIRHTGFKGATIVAGRYVTPRLFVGFEQPLTRRSNDENKTQATEQTTEVQLEYTAYRWLLVNLQGGQSSFRFFFRVKRAF